MQYFKYQANGNVQSGLSRWLIHFSVFESCLNHNEKNPSSLKFKPLRRAEAFWMQASNNCTFSCKSGLGGMLLHHNNNRSICGWNSQFRRWRGVHCMCSRFYCKASYSPHTYRLHTPCTVAHTAKVGGWFVWSICCTWGVRLRPPSQATYVTANPITSHSPPSSSHTRFLSRWRHSRHSAKERSIMYPATSRRREAECKLTPPRAGLRREPEKCLRTEWLRGSRDLSASDGVLWRTRGDMLLPGRAQRLSSNKGRMEGGEK